MPTGSNGGGIVTVKQLPRTLPFQNLCWRRNITQLLIIGHVKLWWQVLFKLQRRMERWILLMFWQSYYLKWSRNFYVIGLCTDDQGYWYHTLWYCLPPGHVIMWSNFIQVKRELNIMLMFYLNSVQGDWINIVGGQACRHLVISG